MAEDKGGSPLPRRVPGTKRGPGTGPLTRPELSDSDLQRIRSALDSAQAQASAPPAERPAPLPRRVRDAGNGSEPPAPTARPESPAALLPTRRKKTPTEPPPAMPAPRPGEAPEGTERQPDVTAEPGPAAAASAGPQLVPAQRAPAEEREERHEQPAEERASPERKTAGRKEETASREGRTASKEEALTVQENGQAGLGKAQLHGTRALTRRPKPAAPGAPRAAPGAPPPPPKPAPPKSAPPAGPASPPVPARSRKRRRGRAIITGSAIATLVLLSAGSSAWLLTQHAGPAKARTDASSEVTVRDDAVAWVAGQVSREGLVSCDQQMCRALQKRGIPAADLLVLRRGAADPLRSAVIVVTPAVRKIVAARLLAADAPAAFASFGSGAGRISIRLIYRQGAAAFFSALRREIADRKAAGASFMQLDSQVTQSAAVGRELRAGQVDARLLLTLGEVASQWKISIVAFGDRGPGASRGISLRSADLALSGGRLGSKLAGLVQMMSGFVHGLGDYFADARIRMVRLPSGQEVVRIAFTAPGRFGLLRTAAP